MKTVKQLTPKQQKASQQAKLEIFKKLLTDYQTELLCPFEETDFSLEDYTENMNGIKYSIKCIKKVKCIEGLECIADELGFENPSSFLLELFINS